MRYRVLFVLAFLLMTFLSGCVSDRWPSLFTPPTVTPGPSATAHGRGASEPKWGVQSKTTGCQPQGPLQDMACTPGRSFPM